MPSKLELFLRHESKSNADTPTYCKFQRGAVSSRSTSRSALRNGNGRRYRLLNTLKIPVFPAIPTARMAITITLKPGRVRRQRIAMNTLWKKPLKWPALPGGSPSGGDAQRLCLEEVRNQV